MTKEEAEKQFPIGCTIVVINSHGRMPVGNIGIVVTYIEIGNDLYLCCKFDPAVIKDGILHDYNIPKENGRNVGYNILHTHAKVIAKPVDLTTTKPSESNKSLKEEADELMESMELSEKDISETQSMDELIEAQEKAHKNLLSEVKAKCEANKDYWEYKKFITFADDSFIHNLSNPYPRYNPWGSVERTRKDLESTYLNKNCIIGTDPCKSDSSNTHSGNKFLPCKKNRKEINIPIVNETPPILPKNIHERRRTNKNYEKFVDKT